MGNWVWFDLDIDGIQDPEEADLGLNDLPVELQFAGADGELHTSDDRTYNTTTQNHSFPGGSDIDGVYYFCGLIDGKYQLSIDYLSLDPGLKPTLANTPVTDKEHDSDGVEVLDAQGTPLNGVFGAMFTFDNLAGHPIGETGNADQDPAGGTTPNDVFGFPDLAVDQSFDFGLQDPDFGDLPVGTGFSYGTLLSGNGPLHVIPPEQLRDLLPFLHLGEDIDADDNGTTRHDG